MTSKRTFLTLMHIGREKTKRGGFHVPHLSQAWLRLVLGSRPGSSDGHLLTVPGVRAPGGPTAMLAGGFLSSRRLSPWRDPGPSPFTGRPPWPVEPNAARLSVHDRNPNPRWHGYSAS